MCCKWKGQFWGFEVLFWGFKSPLISMALRLRVEASASQRLMSSFSWMIGDSDYRVEASAFCSSFLKFLGVMLPLSQMIGVCTMYALWRRLHYIWSLKVLIFWRRTALWLRVRYIQGLRVWPVVSPRIFPNYFGISCCQRWRTSQGHWQSRTLEKW